MATENLKGKIAVATGAASGVSKAMAETECGRGMDVVFPDVERAPLLQVREIFAQSGVKTI